MACLLVRGVNPRALASGLAPVQMDKFYITTLTGELKTPHLKFGIQCYHNKIKMLIFIFKGAYIVWLPFVIFIQNFLLLVSASTCCVIFMIRFWLFLHSLKSKGSYEIK